MIYLSDDDRHYFLKILGDAHERLSALFHVYCLMPNHYHFVAETPDGNLARIMHFVNTAYSVYLSLKHDRCGHLFQGRYKAILLDTESYARVLTIYIHGNPVRKGLVSRPEQFQWSSARAYYGLAAPPRWLRTDTILRSFGGDARTLRQEHEKHLGAPLDPTLKDHMAKAASIGILGNDEFINRIRNAHLLGTLDCPDNEIPEIRRLRGRPEISDIQSMVSAQLGETNRLLKKITIFIVHKNTDYKLREIGSFFGIGPVAVAVAFRKIKAEIVSNESLRCCVSELEARIFGKLADPK